MIGELYNNPVIFVFWLLALVIAITVHEFAHAYVADHLGDPTPRMQGRLTLNPMAHLDPLGTLMILIARFGWGKPVQFDPFNLKNPKRDAALISIAGPISNMIIAIVASILLRIAMSGVLGPIGSLVLGAPMQPIIVLNVVLAVFNLVPIHPLDGFKIVGGILPDEYAAQWYELERYGILFLVFMIFPIFGGASPISNLISPFISFFLSLLIPGAAIA